MSDALLAAITEDTTREALPHGDGETVEISLMGTSYSVPAGSTIMTALESVGFTLVRGCGCRGGFCGACATIFRMTGDYRLRTALACQTQVEPGMELVMVPFVPGHRTSVDLSSIRDAPGTVLKAYPEVAKCLGCNTCTRSCPQDLQPMLFVQAALRGDLEKSAELSFECVMCGLCAARCPAQITPYNVGLLARRVYASRVLRKPQALAERVQQIRGGLFEGELEEMCSLSEADLKRRYEERDFEPL